MYFLRIALSQSVTCRPADRKNVYATIEKGGVYIIPIRVDDSGDSDISRDKERIWLIGVVSDNASLELKLFTVVEKLAGRCTLTSARDYTLNQLVSQVRKYV
jgi:hypothetical protein